MTQVHLGINIRLQYIRNTSEIHSEVTYTSTLPLNQEGILLTQFSAQVFFSVSSGSSSSPHHLQVFFIFKSSFIIGSGSSLDLDHHHWIQIITRSGSSLLDQHHSIWIIITESRSSLDLDHHHHQIQIITQSQSSLDIITGSGSSLDLDHHCWIIITGSGSSLNLDHHGCYLMILFVTGSSTEPAPFHASCRPSLHVGLLQHI